MDPRILQYLLAQQNQPDNGDPMATNPQMPVAASSGQMPAPEVMPAQPMPEPEPPAQQLPPPPPPPPEPKKLFGVDIPKSPQDVASWDKKVLFHEDPGALGVPPATPSNDYSQQILNTMATGQLANYNAANSSIPQANALMQVLPSIANKAGSIGPNQPAVADSSGIQRYFQLLNQLEQAKAQAPIQNSAAQLKILQDLQAAKDKQNQTQTQALGTAQNAQALELLKQQGQQNAKTPEQKLGLTPAEKATDIEFGKKNQDFITNQAPQVAKDIQMLKEASAQLGSDPTISGPVRGMLPDQVRAITNSNAIDVKRKVKAVVLRTARFVLPGVLSDADVAHVLDKAWNDQATPAQNKAAIDNLIQQMQDGYNQKMQAIKYYESQPNGGTLKGYKPAQNMQGNQKTEVSRERNKKTGQIRIKYSDGSTEVMDGK